MDKKLHKLRVGSWQTLTIAGHHLSGQTVLIELLARDGQNEPTYIVRTNDGVHINATEHELGDVVPYVPSWYDRNKSRRRKDRENPSWA